MISNASHGGLIHLTTGPRITLSGFQKSIDYLDLKMTGHEAFEVQQPIR